MKNDWRALLATRTGKWPRGRLHFRPGFVRLGEQPEQLPQVVGKHQVFRDILWLLPPVPRPFREETRVRKLSGMSVRCPSIRLICFVICHCQSSSKLTCGALLIKWMSGVCSAVTKVCTYFGVFHHTFRSALANKRE